MLRGELCNAPASVIAIDWRILVESFSGSLPQVFQRLRMGLPGKPWKPYARFRPCAKSWLEVNWEHRFAVVIIRCTFEGGLTQVGIDAVRTVLDPVVSEVVVLETAQDVRGWLRERMEVRRFYTNDSAILGLDEITAPFTGWHEKI